MHYPPEQLNAYLEGYLQPAESERVASHLADCEACQKTFRELQSLAEWSETHMRTLLDKETTPLQHPDPLAQLARWQQHRKRKRTQPWYWANWLLPAPALALLIFLWPIKEVHQKNHVPQHGRTGAKQWVKKGSTSVEWMMTYAHKHKKISHEAKPRQILYPGDLIQFSYKAKKAFHILLLGFNPKAGLYIIKSTTNDMDRYTHGKGTIPDASAFELDQYVGLERFFVLTSPTPINVSVARQFLMSQWNTPLKRAQTHQAHPRWSISSWLIEKRLR